MSIDFPFFVNIASAKILFRWVAGKGNVLARQILKSLLAGIEAVGRSILALWSLRSKSLRKSFKVVTPGAPDAPEKLTFSRLKLTFSPLKLTFSALKVTFRNLKLTFSGASGVPGAGSFCLFSLWFTIICLSLQRYCESGAEWK